MTVFDPEWLEAPEPLQLQLNRIAIPPEGNGFLQSNWRKRYIFEFLLPPAELTFERRQMRQSEGCFPVDADLNLETVKRQLAIYQQVVLYLHRMKLQVYVREDIDKPPLCIVEPGDAGVPAWATATSGPMPSLTTLDGWKWLILRRDPVNWINLTDQWQKITDESRIAYDGEPFQLRAGGRELRFYPELPLGVRRKYLRRNWLITDPGTYGSKICGFARITPGNTVMLGRSNEEYQAIFNFDKKLATRHVNITNINGDIVITPLGDDNLVEIIRVLDTERRDRVKERRIEAIKQIRDLYGGPIELLLPEKALSLLQEVNQLLDNESFRPRNTENDPGGLIELPEELTPIIVGDLHGQVNNLLKVLTENRFLDGLESETAALILLGDAIHSEVEGEMEDMDSSILIMDLILSLKLRFPANFFYLRGNHDSFSKDISKNGISQGVLMRKRLLELRGGQYVEEMELFYEKLAYIVLSESYVCCHAGPSSKKVTRAKAINIFTHPKIRNDLVNIRFKRPNYLTGYAKSEVKQFRKTLELAKNTPFIVGHTPVDPSGSVWRNVAHIKDHHIIHSGQPSGPGLFVRINDRMIPLEYPAEPLIKIIEKFSEKEY